MKFYWNDVELTEEQYKERWAEWLEHLRLQELKEMEEEKAAKASRKKISGTKKVKKKK